MPIRGWEYLPKPRLVAGQPPPIGAYDADIIILSLGRPGETLEAIASALAQGGVSHHVTVLDQGSGSETLHGIGKTFSRARNFALYAIDVNLGVAAGRNLAASLGHGKMIVGLDNDAVFRGPWVVARGLQQFGLHPDIGILAFNILRADGGGTDRFSWGYPTALLPRFADRFDTTTFVGAGHAIRRATWNAVGGYDPTFFFTWEEYDFSLRAIALGWRIRYEGSLAAIHKISAAQRVAWDAPRTTHYVRNRLIIGRKWGSSWLRLSPRILGYLVKAVFNGRAAPALQGIREAWLSGGERGHTMSAAMRRYVYKNETRHRGSWLARLRDEILVRGADPPPRP